LLDKFLRIESLKAFKLNNDAGGPPVAKLILYLLRIQKAGRSLIIHGEMDEDEVKFIMGNVDCRGFYLPLMVNSVKESKKIRPLVGIN
jgi:4-hydroxy-3-methylbut-2-enyl diphosphate reductase IspH